MRVAPVMAAPLTVYVPAPDSSLSAWLLPGAGMVGSAPPDSDNRIRVDYEGNAYDFGGLSRFADRVQAAAGRHLTHYPTVARATVAADQLVAVGIFDPVAGEVQLDPGADARLADWLRIGTVGVDELLASGTTFDQRRDRRAAPGSDDSTIARAAKRAAHQPIEG